jgi:hypothetical protein
MQNTELTVQSLKQLMNLTQRKEQLLKEITKIEDLIKSALGGGAAPRGRKPGKAKKAAKSAKAPKSAGKPRGRKRRGSLGKKILAALESAGAKGVKVADLANAIGVKGPNLHVWFATTGKKHTKKIGRGHYKLAKS